VTGDNTSKDTEAVRGRPAQAVLNDLDLNGQNWFDMGGLAATNHAMMLARTTLDGLPIGTVVSNLKTEQTDGNQAIVETLALIGAKNGAGDAFMINLNTVKVSPTQSFGQYLNTVTSRVGNVEASVTDLRTVMVDASGIAESKAVFALNTAGKVVGIVSTNNGAIGAIDFVFDRARFLRPNGAVMWGYDETRNVILMPAIEVDTIKALSIETGSMNYNSVNYPYWVELGTDVAMTKNADTYAVTLTVPNVEVGELLKVVGAISLSSSNDLTGAIIVQHTPPGGSPYDLRRQAMRLDSDGNSSTYFTLPVIARHIAAQAGTHTFKLGYRATGNGNYFFKVGTELEVTRQKR
jgi:hypothetical protein